MHISRADVIAAAARIAPFIHKTPVMTSSAFGRAIEFKLEHTQVTGSFKARGAFNSLLTAEVPKAGIVAASGGNHGAAVAHAARSLGHDANIFVPEIAGPAKIEVIKQTGATLHIVPGAYADAAARAAAFQEETGALDIHPYDAVPTLTGQGTCFAEWEAQGLKADTVIIAIGGGGLIGGALSWFDGRRIIGVETQTTNAMHAALQHGPETDVEVSGICANALGAKRIGGCPMMWRRRTIWKLSWSQMKLSPWRKRLCGETCANWSNRRGLRLWLRCCLRPTRRPKTKRSPFCSAGRIPRPFPSDPAL